MRVVLADELGELELPGVEVNDERGELELVPVRQVDAPERDHPEEGAERRGRDDLRQPAQRLGEPGSHGQATQTRSPASARRRPWVTHAAATPSR